jgi:hypothetical protein
MSPDSWDECLPSITRCLVLIDRSLQEGPDSLTACTGSTLRSPYCNAPCSSIVIQSTISNPARRTCDARLVPCYTHTSHLSRARLLRSKPLAIAPVITHAPPSHSHSQPGASVSGRRISLTRLASTNGMFHAFWCSIPATARHLFGSDADKKTKQLFRCREVP